MATARQENQRRQSRIAREAARLLRGGEQPDLSAALQKAARRVCRARPRIGEIPDPREVTAELARLEYQDEQEGWAADDDAPAAGHDDDRFAAYRALLDDLADVKLGSPRHPEGDCLTHSLQAYAFATRETAWDEEFLLAALLHDVGKAIHYRDPVPATLEALDGLVTERTRWFVERLEEGGRWIEGKLSPRAWRRLAAHPDGEALKALARCDAAAVRRAMRVPQLDEALAEIRALSDWTGDWQETDDAPDEILWTADDRCGWG
ncbi:hypothetical protein [Alienimonas californiensis]|uniref:HD domain-containing protein n=1 Tax=Alienimonas californiensis TaxID=2527989 RepID=A0A517P7R1_9PLAN|nr:hypothetical protein [Alienimonas californiensis]QDT15419.1 hypothetical protein CA12_15040 [Alienimonas californiensis]